MGEHAKIAPSALGRIFQCPGSVKLSEGIPERSSRFADEGSLAHEVAALILSTDLAVSDVLDEIAAGMHMFEYGHPDSKMLEHVEGYVDAMRALVALDPDAYFEVEQKVRVSTDIWGTCDFWVWLPMFGMVLCRDLKYGAGQFVEVRGNKQQKAYLLGVVKKLQELNLADRPLEEMIFEMGVYQPRNLGSEGEAHRTQIVTYQELVNFEAELAEVTERVNIGKDFKDGKDCRWCNAAIKCPLNRTAIQELEQQVAAHLEADVSNEQLAHWLATEKRYNRFMGAVKDEARVRLELGEEIAGWELYEGLSNRQYEDEHRALKALIPAIGPANIEALFEPRVLKSPAQIEKLNAACRAAVKGLTIRLPTGYTLQRKE